MGRATSTRSTIVERTTVFVTGVLKVVVEPEHVRITFCDDQADPHWRRGAASIDLVLTPSGFADLRQKVVLGPDEVPH